VIAACRTDDEGDFVYEQQLNRQRPGCVILMVDRSGSMEEPFFGTTTPKKAVVAEVLNDFLAELVLRCVKNAGEPPRDYYEVGVVGYGAGVSWLLGGSGPIPVSELADLGDRVPRNDKGYPVWVGPAADNGTPYGAALDEVGRVLHGWIRRHPASFPPMIVNLTDGAPDDGDPTIWVDRIRTLSTDDGAVLLFNINLSAHPGAPSLFPNTDVYLGDQFARDLFAQSSVLPDPMLQQARAMGLDVSSGARGFGFNVGFGAIAQFLRIGTSAGVGI
jgi:hypothetical protein